MAAKYGPGFIIPHLIPGSGLISGYGASQSVAIPHQMMTGARISCCFTKYPLALVYSAFHSPIIFSVDKS